MTPPPLRVAAVSYLNAVPLVWGLAHGPQRGFFEVNFTVPSQCADALREGRADVGIIPSIEYQRIANLKVIPGLSIASAGPVRSVLLISRCPAERILTLALDTSSRTSACLVQIVLQCRYGVQPTLQPHLPDLPTMLRDNDAALVIGDPALASNLPGLFVYDLAEEWRAMTGLPFVFAFWAVRKEVATPDLIPAFQQAAAYAMAHLEDILPVESVRTGLPVSLVRTYLTENIDFSFSTSNQEGLERFYALAREHGLIERNKPVEFIPEK
ncbi:MAG: menaquinone biosynthesis protein [Acidobacteria bacterium]|nr:menaquinone biosynthesis protein [Acidobacteriota bacterium]